MSNTETMKQVYLLAQEHCGLKVGDWVRVTRKAENHEAGWDHTWVTGSNELLNEKGVIQFIDKDGIHITFPDKKAINFTFPYFVLKKFNSQEAPLKPFDKVLVKKEWDDKWKINLFSHIGDSLSIYHCLDDCYNYCIPYKGNEHLVGTTNKPEE